MVSGAWSDQRNSYVGALSITKPRAALPKSKAARPAATPRERALIATDPNRVPELGLPPNPTSALMGRLTGSAAQAAALEGARTVPPREHGGNCDIKNLSRGAKVYFPVYVKDAGLSMGDIHFSQGKTAGSGPCGGTYATCAGRAGRVRACVRLAGKELVVVRFGSIPRAAQASA